MPLRQQGEAPYRKDSEHSFASPENQQTHKQNKVPSAQTSNTHKENANDEYLTRARELAKTDMHRSARQIIELTTKSIMVDETPDAYNVRGAAKGYLGDRQGEIQDYTQAVTLDPGYFKAYHNRGNARRQSGDKQGAFEDMQRALALKPDYLPSLKSRAVLYHEKGMSNNAMLDLEQALIINPSDPEIFLIRAGIYAESQRHTEAIRDCRLSISLAQSQDALGICAYSNLYAQRYQEALDDFDVLITLLDNTNSRNDAIISRSTAAIALGDIDAVIRDLSKIILSGYDSPSAFAVRGQAYIARGERENACQDWKRAQKQGAESVNILLKRYC